MVTPLYKAIKENGTSFYAFPGSAEDISAAYQNSNYKMYFSKYILLNFPSQNLDGQFGTTQSKNIYWNFGSFSSLSVVQPEKYGDKVIESLRNYVANHEVSIRESRLNNTDYYYDNTALETTTEKIFFKWCKKLGLIGFDLAIGADEYVDDLSTFARNNENDDSYFPEYLWKERSTETFGMTQFEAPGGFLEITINGVSNFRVGDVIEIDKIEDATISLEIYPTGLGEWLGPITIRVTEISLDPNDNHVITTDLASTLSSITSGLQNASIKLVYSRLVQYIGEINGVSNVQEANKAYTEVFAHVPDHTGQTPDILFRTRVDVNYKPGMLFPIIPNQYQPEIIGAELFSSPIVSNPQNYPGGYYGDFDTEDFTYETKNGDEVRRSGDYFGVAGNINAPVVNGSTIDGITVDLNPTHYVKMNLESQTVTNFDTFNALEVNNQPPLDFEFNAILWYYDVIDQNNQRTTNLYGISFLDNPENNPKDEEFGIRFPTFKKLVTNGSQDGTAYQFALNLNFNIIHDNPVEAYNPEAVNSLFSMSLYNEAMRRLSTINDSFFNIIAEHSSMKDEISNLKQLLYSQTDFQTIKSRIDNLDRLLRLYSTNQLASSSSVEVQTNTLTEFATIQLKVVEPTYNQILSYFTSEMFVGNEAIPVTITSDTARDFLVKITNNDEVPVTLNSNLKLLINEDLKFRQSCEIQITGSEFSKTNKKLDLYIATRNPLGLPDANDQSPVVETILLTDIDLPVFFNSSTSNANSAKNWKDFNFTINFNQDLVVDNNNLLEITLNENGYIVNNSIKPGDCLVINNLFIGTNSVFDFSGQYFISTVGATNSKIVLDISTNIDFLNFVSPSLPYYLHTSSSSNLSNLPYFSLNKGKTVKITRISELETVPIEEKYRIEVRDYDY